MKVSNVFFRILPVLFLTTLVIAFFLPLFWPEPKMFTTPDSMLSDILHFNYPLKYLLSESLKNNQLPVWTDLIGAGFPLIGEAEIGVFSLINLILFRLLPFPIAFNSGYVVTFLLFILGMYAVGRELGWSRITSAFTAFLFTFSGFIIVQIPHYNHLQAFSYAPLIFWILLKTIKKPLTRWRWLAPFLISQQFFQGHYQYVFMTGITFFTYTLVTYIAPFKKNRKIKIQFMKTWAVLLLLSTGLCAIQLIPSFEFFLRSDRQNVFLSETFIKLGGFYPSHLAQLFYPYALGDVKTGTYPVQMYAMSSWETFTYIGLIPIILALSSIFLFRRDRSIRLLWVIVVILLLFVLENNSPFYFLFSFAPLSWFRIHSRFLSFLTLFLVILNGYTFEKLQKKYGTTHILILCILCISFLDVWSFASNYNPTLQTNTVLQKPSIVPRLVHTGRLSFFKSEISWFETMYSQGWKDPLVYLDQLSGGMPNYFILHNIASFPLYSGFMLKKQMASMMAGLDYEKEGYDEKTKTATLSALAITTLRLNNVSYITSPFFLENQDVIDMGPILEDDTPLPFRLYELRDTKDACYLSYKPNYIYTVDAYVEQVGKPNILQQYDAFIVTHQILKPETTPIGSIETISEQPTEKHFSIQTNSDAFFTTSLYLYPGWEAYVDGKKSNVVPANLSGMAVFIPKGKHVLTLVFIPKSLYLGGLITGLTLLIYSIIIIRSFRRG